MTSLRRPDLERRNGPPPQTVGPAPHAQRSQVGPVGVQEELWERMRALPYVYMAPTLVSVSHARALFLAEGVGTAPPSRFQRGREFAHLHPHHDGSLHLSTPEWLKDEVVELGWGERHPSQDALMVYGPRDRDELEIVWALVQLSYEWVTGSLD